jgi:hypothetical protein
MLNIVSLLTGAVALLLALPAFLPLLGWMNWFVIPIAVAGLAFGLVSRGRAGMWLNLLVIVVAVLRLMLGGGIL